MSTTQTAQTADKLVHLKPEQILADDNTRFGLMPHQVTELANSILEAGGVLQPVGVEPAVDGKHRLTFGFYRHAAVAQLNAAGAGLLIPAIVRPSGDATERLTAQLSENVKRQNLSPMDSAVAIRRMLDAGMSKTQVRAMFARPIGQKGVTVQPASNAWINIVLGFLTLPKALQAKIHDGRIGVKAAYELMKVDPDKRQAVVERAEKDAETEQAAAERDEAKFLKTEAKEQDEAKKAADIKAAAAKVTEAQKAAEAAVRDANKRKAETEKAFKKASAVPSNFLELKAEEQKPFIEARKAAHTDHQAAVAAYNKASKELEKANKALDKHNKVDAPKAEAQAEAATKKAAKPAPVAAPKPLSQRQVQKAAAAEGVAPKAVALTGAEMRDVASKLTQEKGKVGAIGRALVACFDGITTPKELIAALVAVK